MTRPAPEPFDLLQKVHLPEPDPVAMQQNIAASRRRFEQMPTAARLGGAHWLRDRIQNWRLWLLPVGASMAAIALAMVYILPAQMSGPLNTSGPAADARTDRSSENAGPVFGAKPKPDTEIESFDPQAQAVRHTFGDVQLVTRTANGRLSLSLMQDQSERSFDTRVLDAGETFDLLDAFTLPQKGDVPALLLIRSRLGAATNWDAFVMKDDAITLSGALSLLIHDAEDRTEVEARLASRN